MNPPHLSGPTRVVISRVLYQVVIYLVPPVARWDPSRPTRRSRGAGHTPGPIGPFASYLALLRGAVARAGLTASRGPLTPSPRITAEPVGSYPTLSPLPSRRRRDSAVLFLWPCRVGGLPTPGITRHPALWSPDFPPPPKRRRPPTTRGSNYKAEPFRF